MIRMTINVLQGTFEQVGFSRPADWERDFLKTAYWYYREWTRNGQAKITAKHLRMMFGEKYRDPVLALMIASNAPLSRGQLRIRSRALRYVYSQNTQAKSFLSFVDRAGGIGACARKLQQSKTIRAPAPPTPAR